MSPLCSSLIYVWHFTPLSQTCREIIVYWERADKDEVATHGHRFSYVEKLQGVYLESGTPGIQNKAERFKDEDAWQRRQHGRSTHLAPACNCLPIRMPATLGPYSTVHAHVLLSCNTNPSHAVAKCTGRGIKAGIPITFTGGIIRSIAKLFGARFLVQKWTC
jgi:hypothetical protein